jgi:hypothetical protein|tara:strand:+ start:1006 stop:1389 length:384 start_codon:yes stop_codon:yes gene_type:complete
MENVAPRSASDYIRAVIKVDLTVYYHPDLWSMVDHAYAKFTITALMSKAAMPGRYNDLRLDGFASIQPVVDALTVAPLDRGRRSKRAFVDAMMKALKSQTSQQNIMGAERRFNDLLTEAQDEILLRR